MKRITFAERANLAELADKEGFVIHHIDGEQYWDETRAYQFTLAEIENNIEAPTEELMDMCYGAVDHILYDRPELMKKLQIPENHHQAIHDSWVRRDRDLYGRFDFSYDGTTAKLLEFNADTPTSLYEASVFQWLWLKDQIERKNISYQADQFNSIHEKLIEAFTYFKKGWCHPDKFHFAATLDSDEDKLTVGYLADCALQAGFDVEIMDIIDIGVSADKFFTDLDDYKIRNLFKLYPYEHMFRESPHLIDIETKMFEPLWKSILSNKGILPVLWELYPDHPNLLPAYFADDKSSIPGGYVKKPIFSREGANIEIHSPSFDFKTDGDYGAEGHIVQGLALLPKFGDDYPLIGSWVIAGAPAGIGIREDKSLVTGNMSRFVPHFILDY